MAAGDEFIVGLLSPQALTVTDTVQRHPTGALAWDNRGNEFVYLKGVASTIHGSVVTYDENGDTTLLTTTTILTANRRSESFAVSQSANVASQWGWYATKMQVNVNDTYKLAVLASAVKGASLYATATAGYVDDTATEAGRVLGLHLTATATGTDGVVTGWRCNFMTTT